MTTDRSRIFEVHDPRDQRTYTCKIIPPHILAEAVNAVFPHLATFYAINIGAGDGKSYNDPVYPLFTNGYSGLAIDTGDHPALNSNLPSEKITKVTKTAVTPRNIKSILSSASSPQNPDFLKIDIDGYDGVILKAVLESGYRPKVIQMEINPEFPPPIEFCVLYDHRYHDLDCNTCVGGFYGASMSYVLKLTKPYGYRLAHIDFVTAYTHDITLVHEDFYEAVTDVLGRENDGKSARELFLDHPPGFSHFAESSIDTFPWRFETDYFLLLSQIWEKCLEANTLKHKGIVFPFYLSI